MGKDVNLIKVNELVGSNFIHKSNLPLEVFTTQGMPFGIYGRKNFGNWSLISCIYRKSLCGSLLQTYWDDS